LVQRSIRDALLDCVVARMKAIRPSDPLDPKTTFGPLVSADHLAKVKGYIDSARASGARLRAGGQRLARRGYFLEPTVFDDVRCEMPVAREEIFGPVLSVLTFDTVEEAVSIAHAVDYGLSARIWTRDVGVGYRLARTLRAGDVTVNSTVPTAPSVGAASSTEPFGLSGFGVEGGLEGLRQYTRMKSIHIHLPS